MAAITTSELTDLIATTQRNLGKPNYTQIATDLQDHTAMNSLLKKNRVQLESGTGVQWDVMVNHSASAANVGLGAQDNVQIVDTMVQAQADWRNTTANYSFIGQEIDMNRNPARIVNMVSQRRVAAMISLAELMENNFWGTPVASNDQVTPWGVNTWIVKNATEGFNGGAPSGYTSIGLNPTTYPRWKNWTAPYLAITEDDLISKWRKAATFTKFKPPVPGIPTFNTGDSYAFYTNYTVLGTLEKYLKQNNENLGTDLAKYDGSVVFMRAPVRWVPKLEADTTNPVYGINWGEFKTIILDGWWLKETNVPIYPGQHTVSVTFLDSTYQWVTKNRRCHFVLSNGTSYPS